MNLPTFTLDDVLEAKPCLTRSEVRELWGDRESATALDVMGADDLQIADRVWLLCKVEKALPAEIRTRWIDRTVTRAVTTHALHHPVTRKWARRWLLGVDRSRKSARAARAAAAAAAQAAAVWAAWAATDAADAAADAAAYAAADAAAYAATGTAAWAARAGAGAAGEYDRQLDELRELLEGEG